jgi:biotin carboxyl carrier protein
MNYEIRIGEKQFAVQILDLGADHARVAVDGTAYEIAYTRAAAVAAVSPRPAQDAVPPAASAVSAPADAPLPAGSGAMTAPLPGIILEIRVKPGDAVEAGQTVAVMEAMKMENNLTAQRAGTVREIRVQKGAVVATGDVLMVIA